MVADIADRVVVMYAGRKIEEAPVAELFAQPQHPYTRAARRGPATGPGTAGARLREIPGRVPTLRESPEACTFADRCGRADERVPQQKPALGPGRPGIRCVASIRCRNERTAS